MKPEAEQQAQTVMRRSKGRVGLSNVTCRARLSPGRSAGLLLIAGLVLVAGGRSIEVQGKSIPVTSIKSVDYVSVTDLVNALAGRSWRVGGRLIIVVPNRDSTQPGSEYVFRAESASVLCDAGRIVLPSAPVVQDSEVFVPAAALGELFPAVAVPIVQSFESAQRGETLVVSIRVRRASTRDSLAAAGESRSSLEYRLTPGARVDSAALAQLRLRAITSTGLLKSVGLEASTLVFGFRRPASGSHSLKADGIELRVWPRPERKIGRIVLDAGHGGKDPGAVGRAKGTEEKGLTLDIVKRLKTRLEQQGYSVILTRDSDAYVSLGERSKLANRSRADLFVSIHINSAPNREACGFETYFLSEAKTDWERAVAARENADLDSGPDGNGFGPGDLGLILADLAQNEYLHESSELAGQIQVQTAPYARIKDRGVRQANFYVLRNDYMPAVLVECGFLSNKSEEKLLRQPQHREKLAEGVFRGIKGFCGQYEQNGAPGKPAGNR